MTEIDVRAATRFLTPFDDGDTRPGLTNRDDVVGASEGGEVGPADQTMDPAMRSLTDALLTQALQGLRTQESGPPKLFDPFSSSRPGSKVEV